MLRRFAPVPKDRGDLDRGGAGGRASGPATRGLTETTSRREGAAGGLRGAAPNRASCRCGRGQQAAAGRGRFLAASRGRAAGDHGRDDRDAVRPGVAVIESGKTPGGTIATAIAAEYGRARSGIEMSEDADDRASVYRDEIGMVELSGRSPGLRASQGGVPPCVIGDGAQGAWSRIRIARMGRIREVAMRANASAERCISRDLCARSTHRAARNEQCVRQSMRCRRSERCRGSTLRPIGPCP